MATATVCQQALESEFHGIPKEEGELVRSRLTPEQIAEAELAFTQLGDRPLLPAVSYFIENFREPSIRVALSHALDQFIESKKANNSRPDTIRSLEYKVGKFVSKHAEKGVCDITAADISAEIHRPGLSPITKSNVRRALHGFFEWCVRRKPQAYCADNPVKSIEPIKVDRDEPQILPLDDVKSLMQAAEGHKQGVCMPYVALGLFCAIRPTELARITWNEIDLESMTVTIGAKLAKMRQRRIVEIPKNARQFLLPHALAKTALKGTNWRREFDAVKTLAGYGGRGAKDGLKTWTADIMRHTGISYHLAKHQHEGKTATWAGNSPDVIQRHYKGLVNKKDTNAFWAIAPSLGVPAKGKVIKMKIAA
ncbi:MAG TPA: site-specific integrase [Candidatus Saccharimonadales bacterium]|nr:site-specific integrase [Candidatus Saccharimonadales bacterium]